MAARKKAAPRGLTVADAVRALRRDLDRTQQDLANLVGVTVRTVARWEAGRVAPSGENERNRLAQLGALEQVTPETRTAIARHFAPRTFGRGRVGSRRRRLVRAAATGEKPRRRRVQNAPLRALAYMLKGVAADAAADWHAFRLGLIDVLRAAKASQSSFDDLLRALETHGV